VGVAEGGSTLSPTIVADILCCVTSLVVALGAAERTLFRSAGDDVLRMLIVAYGPYVPDTELGHRVTGSTGHSGRLSRPGHRVTKSSF